MKFHYHAEEPENSSTVVQTHDGALLEIRRGSRTGPGRRFQTVEEWILRMKDWGFFVIPDRTAFCRIGDLLKYEEIRYRDPECPQENRTLVWWRREEKWLQVGHGKKPVVVEDFASWVRALPPGGRFIIGDYLPFDVTQLFALYSDLYENVSDDVERQEAAHYFANFLLDNADELVPVVRQRPGMAQDIRVFLADAKFVYNNLVIDSVTRAYFPSAPALVVHEPTGAPVEREKEPTDESAMYEHTETVQEFCARFRAGLDTVRFVTEPAFRNGLLHEQITWMKSQRSKTVSDMMAVVHLYNLWTSALNLAVLRADFVAF